MNIDFRNEISASYMVVENISGFSADDYAVRILNENRIDGLLHFDYETVNGKTDYLYDISALECFSKTFEYARIGFEDIKNLLFSFNAMLRNIGEFLLDPNNVMLKKECIFIDRKSGRYAYCYLPNYGGNLILEIRELFSALLSVLDYDDTKAVRLAYEMQKSALSDAFTFDSVLKIAGKVASEPENDNDLYMENAGGKSRSYAPAIEAEQKSVCSKPSRTEAANAGAKDSFFKKAGLYFKEQDPGDIFDDINELRIIGKIRKYGTEPEKMPDAAQTEKVQRKDRKERSETAKTDCREGFFEPDLPQELKAFGKELAG